MDDKQSEANMHCKTLNERLLLEMFAEHKQQGQ